MLSSLRPVDSGKELYVKLLDLLHDTAAQFEAMNQLKIPDKVKKAAVNDYKVCTEKFLKLPTIALILALQDKAVGTSSYISACMQQFNVFLEFYNALELLLVRHYMRYKNREGNEYLKTAIDKISDKDIKAIDDILPAMPQVMPQSPRQDGSSGNKEQHTIHHRARSNSTPIYLQSSMYLKKKPDKKDSSTDEKKEEKVTKSFK